MNTNTTYTVREIQNINIKQIKIGKTFKYGDNYNLTNIYYFSNDIPQVNINNTITTITTITENELKKQTSFDDKTKFIIQTPLMYIPNGLIYFNDKPFIELSFNNEEHDSSIKYFKDTIQNIETYVYDLIKRRTSLHITKETFISILKPGYNNKPSKLLIPINLNISKCVINDTSNLGVNKNARNKILFNWDIPTPTYAISIIWVKNIWVKNGKWGINLFMYAMRAMCSHILDPITFMGTTLDNKNIKPIDIINTFHKDEKMSILVCDVPEYAVYYKMLKMGIPRNAVKHKMTLQNLNTRIIDFQPNTLYITVLHYLNNPHLFNNKPVLVMEEEQLSPKHIENVLTSNTNSSNTNTTSNNNTISNNNTTSNTNTSNTNNNTGNTKTRVIINKNQNMYPVGIKVPSLNDIQSALSKLKRQDLANPARKLQDCRI